MDWRSVPSLVLSNGFERSDEDHSDAMLRSPSLAALIASEVLPRTASELLPRTASELEILSHMREVDS